jgi:tetratricopeptide (TPR) repeat protein
LYKAILSLGIFLALTGCTDNSKHELLSAGIRSIDENDHQGAIAFLSKALQKDPNLFEARFQLARACLFSDKLDCAEKELKKVVYQSPSYADAHIALAGVYLKKAMPDEALRHIESYLNAGHEEEEAFAMGALAHAMKGNYEDAVELLNQAVMLDDSIPETTVELARSYPRRPYGYWREEINELDRSRERKSALGIAPETVNAELSLALSHEREKLVLRR